jgi:small subunit ribosomal protein S6
LKPYEMTFIVRPDLDEDGTRAAADSVTDRITGSGGEIIATYPWNPARRRMAYPIRDFGDGFYVTTTFRIESTALREIENALRLNDRILRFLVVQATDLQIKQSQQRMQQANAPQPAPQPAASHPAAQPPTGPGAPVGAGPAAAPQGAPAAPPSSAAPTAPTPTAPASAGPAPAQGTAVESVPAPPSTPPTEEPVTQTEA